MLPTTRAWPAEQTEIPNYKHTTLTVDQGAPAPVFDIAQTKDGYLWIASRYGLWRYDGVQFEHVQLPDSLPRRSTLLRILFADREGNLWIGHDWGGLTLFRAGTFRNMNLSALPGQPFGMFEDARGRVWILCTGASGTHLWRFDHGRKENLTDRLGLRGATGLGMLQARDGTIWLALRSGAAYLRPGASRFTFMPGNTGDYPTLTETADGRIWIASGSVMQQLWDGVRSHAPRISPARMRFPNSVAGYRSTRDSTGTVWVGASGSGLVRLKSSAKGRLTEVGQFPAGELSSPIINSVFTDREDNLWIGTNRGIDKFRPVSISKILSYQEDLSNYSLTGSSVMQGPRDVVIVKSGGRSYRVQGDGSLRVVPNSGTQPAGLCVDNAGSIWIRKNSSLLRSGDGRRIAIPPEPGTVYAPSCVLGKSDWWITSVDGLFHLERDGTWKRFSLDPKIRGTAGAQIIALDHTGSLIANFGNWKTFRVTSEKQELFLPQDNPLGFINFITRVGDELFIGGTKGLARYGPRGLQILGHDRYPLLDEVTGFAARQGGEAWIAVRSGLVSTSTKSLESAFGSSGQQLRFREYGPRDGLDASGAGEFNNTLALDRAGRLWIATMDGIFMLDPTRLNRNQLSPPVVIKSITANDEVRKPIPGLVLPEATSQLQIDFTAPSLRDPQRVRFRYRLKGHDRDWTDAGTRRQAIYTDLAPGSYEFQVIAANEDGVWNDKGALLSFVIPPTFLQSKLFRVLCGAALLLAAGALYRLRLRQLGARIEARLIERVGERERIARELHDTLLQGVQGLILGLQNVADDLPGDAPARSAMTKALDRADDLLTESRDRVHDLRRSTQARSLPEALTLLAERTLAGTDIEVRSAVVGEERDLHPVVADEMVRLSEEALFNIYKHARASRVTIGVTFGKHDLALVLEDDGVGLPDGQGQSATAGRHFGLKGMRERATRIGGKFTVSSRRGAGTSVQVTVPASAAYTDDRRISRTKRRFAQWARRLSRLKFPPSDLRVRTPRPTLPTAGST